MGKNFIPSVFMVAGCAMGAGCLAMPMLAAGPNFVFSSISLVLVGVFSYLFASLSLEVFLHYKNEVNLSTIAGKNFGKIGIIFSGGVNFALMYALLSVYMTGGADMLDKTILPLLDMHVPVGIALLFFLIITLPIFFKGTELVVKSNKIVFWLKLISFLVAIFIGLRYVSGIISIVPSELIYLPRALPLFYGALWFHFLIPVIARINNYDRSQCNKIFATGVAIPVVLYIMWIGIMLSLIPRDGVGHSFVSLLLQHESVGTMINFATINSNIPSVMKFSLNMFSNIAMLTSFLSVGISTYDYIRDAFKIVQTNNGKLLNLLITMLPPAIFAAFFPDGFVLILQQAIILLMLINAFMLMCLIKEYPHLDQKPNKFLIFCLAVILVIFIILQILDNFSVLPALGFY